MDGCLKKISLVEENFKENVENLSSKVRKLGDFDKISGNIDVIFNKCEVLFIFFLYIMNKMLEIWGEFQEFDG